MLTKRLSEILKHTIGSNILVDVGCDHGILGYEALKRGYALRVIATDVSDKSLDKARRLFAEYGYVDNAQFRCGDGLSVVESLEADTVVISGMGGMEIIKILTNSDYQCNRLVLSPQSDTEEVRRYLVGHGYRLNYDYVIFDTKFYWIIVAVVGEDEYTEDEFTFGRDNLNGKCCDFIKWIDVEIDRFNSVISKTDNQNVKDRFKESIAQYENLKKHVLSGGI